MAIVLPESLGASAADLKSPLYAAWQLTNECDLCCLHCIEGSGPGKAFPDELSKEEAFRIADQLLAAEVPYVAFSGGEPFLQPNLASATFAGAAPRRPTLTRPVKRAA